MALYLGGNNYISLASLDGYALQDSNGVSLVTTALSIAGKVKIKLNNITYHVNVNLTSEESE